MYTNKEYQQIQQRLGDFFLGELEQITQTYNLGGDAMRQALNQFEREWAQLRQLWEQLTIRATAADIALCAKLVQAFQAYFLVRVSFEHIIDLLERILNLLSLDNDPTTRLAALFLLGSAHHMKTDHVPMIGYFDQAKQIAQAEKSYWYLNEIDNKLSHYYLETAHYDDALTHAKRVLLEGSNATEKQQASAALNVGNVLTNRKEFVEAEVYFLRGLAHFDQIQDWNGIMHTHVNLGRLFAECFRHDLAIQHYQTSLEINNRILKNKRINATVLFNLAVATNRIGAFEKSLVFANESLTAYTELGDKWGISLAMNTIGIVHLRQGRHDEAEAIFRDLISIRYDIGFASGAIFVIANRVQNWNLAGEYEKARDVLRDHLPKVLTTLSDQRPRLRLVGLAVWTLVGLGLTSEAIFDLFAHVRDNAHLDWEIDSFIEHIKNHRAGLDTISSSQQELSTEDALLKLAEVLSLL